MSQAPNLEPDAEAGFTLIEALAALTVALIGLAALHQLTYATARNVAFAETRLELVSAARKAYTALPPRADPAPSKQAGILNGQRWRLTRTPYQAPEIPGGALGWRPERVALEIEGAGGVRLRLDTVRLSRVNPP